MQDDATYSDYDLKVPEQPCSETHYSPLNKEEIFTSCI